MHHARVARLRGFTLIEILTALGVISILSLAVLPFLGRFPRAVASIEERQAAVILLDAQVERARYLVAGGSAGPGETVLLSGGEQAGGILPATCSMDVREFGEAGMPPGLLRVVVVLECRGEARPAQRLERSFLIRAPKGGSDAE